MRSAVKGLRVRSDERTEERAPLTAERIWPSNAPVRGEENKENLLGTKKPTNGRLHKILTLPLYNALSKQLVGVRALLCSKNTLTPQTLLEMDVESRTCTCAAVLN
jgi:hypothetical protein